MATLETEASLERSGLATEFDPLAEFIRCIPELVNIARDEANFRSISYRRFHVGAALIAATADRKRFGLITGANIKPDPSFPKYCAEMCAIDLAEALKFEEIAGIVVAGTSDPDKIRDVTGRVTPTLHCCTDCQARMESSPLVHDDTLIVTTSLESSFGQVHSFAEMRSRYAIEPEEAAVFEVPVFDITTHNWGDRAAVYEELVHQNSGEFSPAMLAKLALSPRVRI